MSRVEINADGRQVIVDHVGDLPYLIEKALDTWRETDRPRPAQGGVLRHAPGCICTLYRARGWEDRVRFREAGCPVHGADGTGQFL